MFWGGISEVGFNLVDVNFDSDQFKFTRFILGPWCFRDTRDSTFLKAGHSAKYTFCIERGKMSTVAPIFKRQQNDKQINPSQPPPSSDPFQPIPASILANRHSSRQNSPATFLPVAIELSHFRPIAFRVFTKKHNYTLKSDALALLAEHIGRKCGTEWRILGEPILDEIVRAWTRAEGLDDLFTARTNIFRL
jgi:hypothetical protein